MASGVTRPCRWRRWGLLALILALALLTACAGPRSRARQQVANNVLIGAMSLVGTPYHWGGNSPQGGFDCSGLVQYVFAEQARLQLPRTTRAQSRLSGSKLKRGKLRGGDLVFFRGGSRRISHVGIYVGDKRFVHAPTSGGTVRLDSLDNPYWKKHFRYGRRVLD